MGQYKAITAIKEALAQPEQEPVALETLLKWDDDIDPIGEVVGFIEGSPYIMVKVHKGKQVSLDDDLYATPPQRTEQEPVAYSGNGTAGREADVKPTGFFFQMPKRSESSGKPSAWVGLTDDEIQECYSEAYKIVQGRRLEIAFYKTIEAKLKQKNGYAEEKNT
jgi:hypothetical protein